MPDWIIAQVPWVFTTAILFWIIARTEKARIEAVSELNNTDDELTVARETLKAANLELDDLNDKLKLIDKKPAPSQELKAFLGDLEGGAAFLHVRRVPPEDVVLRSPRDAQ